MCGLHKLIESSLTLEVQNCVLAFFSLGFGDKDTAALFFSRLFIKLSLISFYAAMLSMRLEAAGHTVTLFMDGEWEKSIDWGTLRREP